MKNIFLPLSELAEPLTLEPTEDTLYLLPQAVTAGVIHLTLATPGVRVFMVGLFHTKSEQNLTIEQNHTAPDTESHVILKTVVGGSGNFSYQGNIFIDKKAIHANASQEARALLISDEARFKAVPSLEILPKNVTCKHKASSAPVNRDSLFILSTKGFSEAEATNILEGAFLKQALDTLQHCNVPVESIRSLEKTLLNT